MVHMRTEKRGGASIRFANWGYRHASRAHFAIRGLDLDIPAGQKVLLLGASGIGKSTILEAAAGLLGTQDEGTGAGGLRHGESVSSDQGTAPEGTEGLLSPPQEAVDSEGGTSAGTVEVDGVPAAAARGKVGLVLQDPEAQAIFERVGDNVAFGPENMAVPMDRIWSHVRKAMADTGLEGMQLHRSTTHLSGGQMQRLALAGALAMQPGVLLLDEPTANLDPDGVGQVVASVRASLEATGATMVLVEHRTDPWIDMIDRVVVLGRCDTDVADGEGELACAHTLDAEEGTRTCVVADGTPDEVFGDHGLDFASLGIWVPKCYRRAEDEIRRIQADDSRRGEETSGTGRIALSAVDLAVGRRGEAIAEHMNIDFASGQVTAIVGGNGAGKSTLALTLAGLLEPVSGKVEAAPALASGATGNMPFGWSSRQLAARISYVFQNPEHQFARGSVLEEVMLGPLRTGVGEVQAQATARRLLSRFKLSQYEEVNPYTLSGGEKRRLTVASALAAAPDVVILDEPTFGQDRVTWMQMAQLIDSIRADGICVIVITHDLDLVTALGARVVELAARGSHGAGASIVQGARGRDIADGIVDVSTAGERAGTASLLNPVDMSDANGGMVDARWCQVDQRVEVSRIDSRSEAVKPSSRSPFLASLNPAYRMIGGFLAALPLIVTLDWVSATVALVLEFLLLACIGLKPWRVVASTWPVFIGAPGSALAVLLYGKSGGALWWHWGMINVTDRSIALAIATGLRVLAIGIPAIIAVLGIDATDLADSFSQVLHLPDRFVYGGLAGMRMFSVLRDDWSALTASRRSRGLGDDNKVKAFFPQAFALFVLSIRRSTTLAVAMEARGFGAPLPRTHARVSAVHTRDKVFVGVCLLIPVIALIASGMAGTFVFFGG